MRSRLFWGAFLAALLMAVPLAVMASHYPLEAVPFIPEKHKSALSEQKIIDTEELLNAGLTAKARKGLARKTDIKRDKLTEYVYMCDLLRVRGVGPKMARLLTLAGVKSIEELRAEKPETLVPKMKTANQKHSVSEILPQEDTTKDWIHQARNLEIIVK